MAVEKQVKVTKAFDYVRPNNGGMTSYPAGFEGSMPQAHYDAAVAAGAVDGGAAATTAKDVKIKD